MKDFCVIDFETTGLSIDHGAVPIEVGICKVKNGKIIDRYDSLINYGVDIPRDIEKITGINNKSMSSAPKSHVVKSRVKEFTKGSTLVAHNASFDSKFYDYLIGENSRCDFICTLLLSRRIFQSMRKYSLESLVTSLNLEGTGQFHRALADAEYTSNLLLKIFDRLRRLNNNVNVDSALLYKIQRTRKELVEALVNV